MHLSCIIGRFGIGCSISSATLRLSRIRSGMLTSYLDLTGISGCDSLMSHSQQIGGGEFR